ncbi:hypothetical protein VARIO8X_50502 [Burkholderiales bacterium 8X]|nr:hypothetical protein VARIO8X_50502 [Burkholderiales bacterium 8X]
MRRCRKLRNLPRLHRRGLDRPGAAALRGRAGDDRGRLHAFAAQQQADLPGRSDARTRRPGGAPAGFTDLSRTRSGKPLTQGRHC